MYLPKADLYNRLKTLPYFVAQTKPAVFTELPAVMFGIGNQAVRADLDGGIASQEIEIQMDIWAEDSVSASEAVSRVEGIMRSNQYRMSYASDVPNPGNLHHVVCRFSGQV